MCRHQPRSRLILVQVSSARCSTSEDKGGYGPVVGEKPRPSARKPAASPVDPSPCRHSMQTYPRTPVSKLRSGHNPQCLNPKV
ncbi:hypothetical protein IF1G_08688 [Cordyceps javanica]|uniref:Uncharacterized protein n=1 Tax=Cordyceps javanica TaxID=43265 RepID=A0A545UTH5_9HYPO|nr:hypothetical protein IF1G_08688 [Cordyceps javanica]